MGLVTIARNTLLRIYYKKLREHFRGIQFDKSSNALESRQYVSMVVFLYLAFGFGKINKFDCRNEMTMEMSKTLDKYNKYAPDGKFWIGSMQ